MGHRARDALGVDLIHPTEFVFPTLSPLMDVFRVVDVSHLFYLFLAKKKKNVVKYLSRSLWKETPQAMKLWLRFLFRFLSVSCDKKYKKAGRSPRGEKYFFSLKKSFPEKMTFYFAPGLRPTGAKPCINK